MHNETEADYAYAKGVEDGRRRYGNVVGVPSVEKLAVIRELMSEIIAVVKHGNEPTSRDPYIRKAVEYVRKLCKGEEE